MLIELNNKSGTLACIATGVEVSSIVYKDSKGWSRGHYGAKYFKTKAEAIYDALLTDQYMLDFSSKGNWFGREFSFSEMRTGGGDVYAEVTESKDGKYTVTIVYRVFSDSLCEYDPVQEMRGVYKVFENLNKLLRWVMERGMVIVK